MRRVPDRSRRRARRLRALQRRDRAPGYRGPQRALRVSLLTRLFRSRRWVVGWVLGVVGIAPQVLAFGDAPFVVVQTALASGLLILLFIGSRLFGEHVGWVEIAGVSAIIAGVALVAWGVPPRVETHRSGIA